MRDLNELYNMVCSDRYEYTQAVQAVVNFSGLQGEELAKVLPTYTSQSQPGLTTYDGNDVIMGGGSLTHWNIDLIMPQANQDDYLIVTDNEIDLYTSNSDFEVSS